MGLFTLSLKGLGLVRFLNMLHLFYILQLTIIILYNFYSCDGKAGLLV